LVTADPRHARINQQRLGCTVGASSKQHVSQVVEGAAAVALLGHATTAASKDEGEQPAHLVLNLDKKHMRSAPPNLPLELPDPKLRSTRPLAFRLSPAIRGRMARAVSVAAAGPT
jgi:hypothetical protein